MGRPFYGRLRVRGWLLLVTPVHVGGLAGDPEVDLTLARDGRGELVIPGTSLAGPLRAWTEMHLRGAGDELWGSARDGGHASRAVVNDGSVRAAAPSDGTDGGVVAIEVRDGVGIDRVTGTSASGILYRRAVIPRGAVVRLSLDVESADAAQFDRDQIGVVLLVHALAGEEVRFGAGKTRGLGRVRLLIGPNELELSRDRFDSKDAMLDSLVGSTSWSIDDLLAMADEHVTDRRPTRMARVSVSWAARGPVMVRSSVEGFYVDSLPAMSGIGGGKLAPVLPGSSLKGALRSRAELVVRTVTGEPASGDGRARFLEQLRQFDVVNALFGAAPAGTRSDSRDGEEVPDGEGSIGALGVDDCYAAFEHALPATTWVDVVTPGPTVAAGGGGGERPSMPKSMRAALADRGFHELAHVAIDRWTGGAAVGRLYSVLEPAGVAWDDIEITLDLGRLPEALHDAALALLILTLRELRDGRVRFGYATNRGMGDAEVTSVVLDGFPWGGGELDELPVDDRERLEAAWTTWVEGVRP